eukprot:c18683_g2_i1.p1 GENE.c18683_g2_i1~~c18683_g2_i1.p1  ORF type:complete len:334 (-),score=81.02 c18683_g2_i1:42-1043(-)
MSPSMIWVTFFLLFGICFGLPFESVNNTIGNRTDEKKMISPDNTLLPKMESDLMEQTNIFDIIVVIPTMRRWTHEREIAPEQYLTPLVDGIIESLTPIQHNHTKILLYNVDPHPELHTEVSNLKNKYATDILVVVNKTTFFQGDTSSSFDEMIMLEKPNGEKVQITKGTMNWIKGETRDATKILFEARNRAPYVMFLEDDVKPTKNVITKLWNYLDEMSKRKIENWFMVDLYTPSINWGRNPGYVANYERYDYECCTQAMLFRSDKLLDLLIYESSHSQFPIDDNIRDYSREEEETRGIYAITPNLFEHVGRFSSNPEKSSDKVEHTSLSFLP